MLKRSLWLDNFRYLCLGLIGLIYLPIIEASTLPVTGQPNPRLAYFEHQFLNLIKSKQMVGATVAIMQHGSLVYARGFGWANLQKKEVMYPNALFRLASMSKTVTAMAILKMVDQGLLSLDTPFNQVLHLTPLPGRTLNPAVNNITIANLLNMASGWAGGQHRGFDPLFGHWPKKWLDALNLQAPVDCRTAARFMLSRSLIAPPGRVMSYNNINYCVLGLVISHLAASKYPEKSYQQYLQQEILQPLGISDMQIAGTRYEDRLPREVTYYPLKGADELPYSNTNILANNFADGGLVGSAVDLARLAHALQTGKIVNRKLWYLMGMKPAKIPYLRSSKKYKKKYYGMGWFIQEIPIGKIWIAHGSFTGTNTLLIRRPDNTIVVYFFNKKPSYWAGLETFREQLTRLALKVPNV